MKVLSNSQWITDNYSTRLTRELLDIFFQNLDSHKFRKIMHKQVVLYVSGFLESIKISDFVLVYSWIKSLTYEKWEYKLGYYDPDKEEEYTTPLNNDQKYVVLYAIEVIENIFRGKLEKDTGKKYEIIHLIDDIYHEEDMLANCSETSFREIPLLSTSWLLIDTPIVTNRIIDESGNP